MFPIMINRLTKSHGFPTAVRASAGLVTGLMVIANCIMKPRFPPKTIAAAPIKRLTVTDLVKDLPYMLNVLSYVYISYFLVLNADFNAQRCSYSPGHLLPK